MMLRRTLPALLFAGLLSSSSAFAQAPPLVPVQGVVADDVGPLEGAYDVQFTLYADSDGTIVVWSEAQTVPFANGFFSAQLGAVEPVDLSLFADSPELYLGIAIDGDEEMSLIRVATAPFAAYAAFAGDSGTLDGRTAEDFAPAGGSIAWDRLTDIPSALADGDDDTTYTAGNGLALDGDAFSLAACGDGQTLQFVGGAWGCADPASGGAGVSAFTLDGTTLRITATDGPFEVDLAPLLVDGDTDATNELNGALELSGTTLQLTDAGGTRSVDLAPLVAAADAPNEFNTAVALIGTVLNVVDGNGTLTADLASLVDDADANPSNEIQSLQTTAVPGEVAISDGNSVRPFAEPMSLSVNFQPSWDDLWTGGGSELPLTQNGDDNVWLVALDFPMVLDGVEYSNLMISSNGWLKFADAGSNSDLSNDPLPTSIHTEPFIAAYWDDLVSTVRYGTVGTAPNRQFIVLYDARLFSPSDATLRFGVTLHEGSSAIRVVYYSVSPSATGGSATIGYQGAGGSAATAYPVGANVPFAIDDNAASGTQSWSIAPVR